MQVVIHTAADMELLGARLAACLRGGEIIFFQGELGAGKTTLVRGLLHGLGYRGNVKSPTYTLVEMYSVSGKQIYHFDLYRLNTPEELEEMGLRDYCEQQAVCLFEWPERAEGAIPEADLAVVIAHADESRKVAIHSHTATGNKLLGQLDVDDLPYRL